MFYNVTFLTWNKDLKTMTGGATLVSIMYLGTVVVGIFAVVFLLYTNSFLMKRRQKELGLYNILGMSKRHIALVMLWETLYTCMITIVGGLLLGMLLSKLLMLLLFKLLFFTVKFGFSVSLLSIGVTTALFVGIYLLALIRNLVQVRLSKPVELLRGGDVGEREPKTKKILAILGVLTLGAGYGIALTVKSPLDALMLFFVAVILVILGTYCLFTAGSIALLKGMKRRKGYYYQPKHFIGVSGMLYRMKQNAVGLANICILSTMVLVMLSTCVCMYLGIDDALDTMYPHHMTFSQTLNDPEAQTKEEIWTTVQNGVKDSGLKTTKVQEREVLILNTTEDHGIIRPTSRSDDMEDLIYTEIVTVDGYTQMTGQTLTLSPGQVAAYSTEEQTEDTLTIMNTALPVVQWLEDSPAEGYSTYTNHQLFLVVANERDLEQLFQQLAQSPDGPQGIQWEMSLDFDASRQQVVALYDQLQDNLAHNNGSFGSSCRQAGEAEVYTLYGSLLFLGLFLGALFLMATVLIIYYKQISEGYEDKERFAILEKVGMSQQQVRSAIRSQVRAVFFLPLVGAVIHLAAAFRLITKLMGALSLANVTLFVLTCLGTAAVFAVGYFVIYALTARTYYKIVR